MMLNSIYKAAITGVFCISLLSGCITNLVIDQTEDYGNILFNAYIINQKFTVSKAIDGNADLTSDYEDYSFILKQGYDNFGGPMIAIKENTTDTISGTWLLNSDYSKLDISLTTPYLPAFIFLNRSWRFTKKEFSEMQLAPWGSTDPKVLYMKRKL
ncbi:MAG: hypothetical protein HY305_06880, partial [Sphingobacteriales bacterium]|nr:hypothetical protein [Sphingobacteriales bacterium]